MSIKRWLKSQTSDLSGKRIAISGSTGGLGRQICKYSAALGAELILMDRNPARSNALKAELTTRHPDLKISQIQLDLSDMGSVRSACEALKKQKPHIIIHNAGAYSIPRYKCETGLDNVFQINFASPYYITKELLPTLREVKGKVIAVGSIAHNYSKTDPADIDFSARKAASKVYGNAKRFLMFSLFELFKEEKEATLSVTHPGITFTGITAHYPKLIFAIIKHPMKIIFMKPKKAALCIIKGIFDNTNHNEWIGPGFFNIWGMPKKKRLKTVSADESKWIGKTAEEIYNIISSLSVT